MSKRNIAYVKPQDPSFLARLKNQIGYKEGPTVETKKQKLYIHSDSDDDCGDRDTEKPVVVVLKEGDLTAEEAAREEARIAREAAEAPADLNKRIIFKKRNKDSSTSKETLNVTSSTAAKKSKTSSSSSSLSSSVKAEEKKSKTSSKKEKHNKNKLSFTNEDEEEDEQ